MAVITCARCKRETEGFAQSPLPGPQAAELVAHTCPSCFQDWMGNEIMIINEYRLDVSLPRNQELLNQEMARFLNLPSSAGSDSGGKPPGYTPPAGG